MGSGVVVVGAGPVGMATALGLARAGVDSVLLDAAQGLTGEGSKAICVQRDVLDVLDRLGVGRQIAGEGVSWTLGRTYFRSRELFQTRLPMGDAFFPPFVNLPQCRTEELLLAAVAAHPRVTLRWGCELTGLRQDGEGVSLSLATPDGPESLMAGWVVGCDGGRSRVRALVGVDFPGHTHADRFLIADVRADLPFPDERRFFFDPPFNPGRTVLIHPQPDRVWRFDWQVPPEIDAQEERRTGRLDARIRAITGDTPYELVWLSSYRFSQRVAPRFRVGSVLLAGDAAHLMSPFGARGMNSGLHDAENLAWKLALVVHGLAPDALLDSYHEERHAAAVENLRVTDATMRFMVPRTRARRVLRDATLLASRVPALRRRVDSGRLATPFDYAGSSLVLAPREDPPAGPRAGQLAPDATCRVVGEDRPRRLRELVGPETLVLALPAGDLQERRFLDGLGRQPPRAPVRVLLVTATGGEELTTRGVTLLQDPEGALARRYRRGQLFVVRPDGYLGAGPLPLDGAQVGHTVDACTGNAAPAGAPAAA